MPFAVREQLGRSELRQKCAELGELVAGGFSRPLGRRREGVEGSVDVVARVRLRGGDFVCT